ncbi:MAG: hypothetical protein M3N52_00815, partial [Actinomycetota bacterium]|nr:hypothetical protein [Actinomycetota bacterium]
AAAMGGQRLRSPQGPAGRPHRPRINEVDGDRRAAGIIADEPPARSLPAVPGPPSQANEELTAARHVAAQFAVGLATYRYDDGPDATLQRVRPYVTADLAGQLGPSSGATAARGELAGRQEAATAVVEAVQTDTVGDGSTDLLLVIRQQVASLEGSQTRVLSYLVRVVRTPVGWLVAGFQP